MISHLLIFQANMMSLHSRLILKPKIWLRENVDRQRLKKVDGIKNITKATEPLRIPTSSVIVLDAVDPFDAVKKERGQLPIRFVKLSSGQIIEEVYSDDSYSSGEIEISSSSHTDNFIPVSDKPYITRTESVYFEVSPLEAETCSPVINVGANILSSSSESSCASIDEFMTADKEVGVSRDDEDKEVGVSRDDEDKEVGVSLNDGDNAVGVCRDDEDKEVDVYHDDGDNEVGVSRDDDKEVGVSRDDGDNAVGVSRDDDKEVGCIS